MIWLSTGLFVGFVVGYYFASTAIAVDLEHKIAKWIRSIRSK